MHTAHNDNYNPSQPYCEGGNFNIIAPDIAPTVARNAATYYSLKEQPWADGMAARLRAAANDNAPVAVRCKRRAA